MSLLKKVVVAACAVVLSLSLFTGCADLFSANEDSSTTKIELSSAQDVSEKETGANDFKITGNVDDNTKKIVEEDVRRNEQIKPGANITVTKNNDGSTQYSYENPDGGGGGGIIMD